MISTGWTLLRQPDRDDAGGQGANPECREADYSRQAFYPLTLPLTVGPGSISVAITVGTNRPEMCIRDRLYTPGRDRDRRRHEPPR